eukprot:TRINITY_DN18759_c0_g1_i1.p1 TRINITY_DN18759_c0_g1~~TRINITY_DN18759_c0_g1_i1.p1  ORF type:complete len:245 (+),score=27.25 TRINITY_DN18759_c0_g1_i1:89-736(+)
MCEWGLQDPWKWAPPIANQWRTAGDHHDNWDNTLKIINAQAGLSQYSGIGAWNYMDFIYTGGQTCKDDPKKHCPGMTDVEYLTEFSFWSLLNSGLIVATDIRIMTPIMKQILYNTEIIAINQDSLRKQGDRVLHNGDIQIWSRTLSDESSAVILFNSGNATTTITLDYSLLKWQSGTKGLVRDLWSHKDLGVFSDTFTASVQPHAVVYVKIVPQK